MMKPNSTRFSMSYSEQEAPVIVPIEYTLMKELGMDRSTVHKVAIKEFGIQTAIHSNFNLRMLWQYLRYR